jgi:NAD(P)-dependent dehydrogenase (short-subunit alcohol dehydrogenase family)
VLPGMLERGSGKIVIVSSRSASVPSAGITAYTVSKAGLNMLVQCLAEETRQHGVNVNAVAPSVIDTPSNRQFNPDTDYSTWVTPESIAGVMRFLASDAARDIHGAIVPIYGRA